MHGRMWPLRSKGQQSQRAVNTRRAKRLRTDALKCDFGDVVDISSTGMRVQCPRKPPVKVGQVFEVRIQSDNNAIKVRAQTVWVRRHGLRSYQVGMHFVKANRSLTAAVESLAMFGFIDLEAAAQLKTGADFGDGRVTASVTLPDYYTVLGIDPDSSQHDIQHAYRALALKFHPDVCDDPGAADHFMRITEAYDVLRDPQSRKSYDLSR
jgi:hypothetical protein